MTRVAVLNYGVGNLKSMMNALTTLDCEAILSNDSAKIMAAEKIIIPGVGAFAYCMKKLRDAGLETTIKRAADAGKSVLGICVGMQMLFEASEEHGDHAGLGLIRGRVKRLPVHTNDDVRLPHIGWNFADYQSHNNSGIFSSLPERENYYFVHSFACYPDNKSTTLATTCYAGTEFVSAVIVENLSGLQFHPERSGRAGLALLNNFVNA